MALISVKGLVLDYKFTNAGGGMPIIVEIKMPPFLTSPPLYTKFGGMVIVNTNDVVNYSKPASEDWLVDGPIVLKDSEIVLDKNLTLVRGGSFTMDNVTMKIESSNNTKYGIYVGEGAKLIITNSSISSTNISDTDNLLYDINVFGNITLDNSNLSYSQGLNIYGGSASIENCSFYKNPLNISYSKANIACNRFTSCDRIGLMYDSSLIRDNIFENMTSTIFGFGEDFHFYGNLVNNSGSSILCSYRTSKVNGNNISNCEYGISLSGCSRVTGNQISNVTCLGIGVDEGICVITNNSLIDSGGLILSGYMVNKPANGFNAIIENNLIRNSRDWGIQITNMVGILKDNSIINSTLTDIASRSSELIISNNTLCSKAPLGIISRDSTLFIINTTIDESYTAIGVMGSSVTIVNSTILNDAKGKFKIYGEMEEKSHILLEEGSTVKVRD